MDEHIEGGHDIARLPNPLSRQLVNQTSSDPTTIMEREEEVEELSFMVAYLFSPALLIVAILLVRTLPSIHSPSSILHSFDSIIMVTYLKMVYPVTSFIQTNNRNASLILCEQLLFSSHFFLARMCIPSTFISCAH